MASRGEASMGEVSFGEASSREDGAGMSKYLLDKFLYTVDRDPDLVERYRDDPAGTVSWWEQEMANRLLNCHSGEQSTWLAFSDEERRAVPPAAHTAPLRLGGPPLPP